MPTRYEWGGGYYAVWYEPDKKEIVWWGAEHPKGGHEYDSHTSVEQFMKWGLGGVDDVPPLEILRSLYGDVAAHLGLPAEPVGERFCAAVRSGDLATMRSMLDSGVSPDTCDLRSRQALDAALDAKQDAAAELLVARGVTLTHGYLLPSRALLAHCWRTFHALVKAGCPVNGDLLKDSWPWLSAAAPLDVLDTVLAHSPTVPAKTWELDKVKMRLAEDAAFSRWAAKVRGAARP
jgi:hypothetical protein